MVAVMQSVFHWPEFEPGILCCTAMMWNVTFSFEVGWQTWAPALMTSQKSWSKHRICKDNRKLCIIYRNLFPFLFKMISWSRQEILKNLCISKTQILGPFNFLTNKPQIQIVSGVSNSKRLAGRIRLKERPREPQWNFFCNCEQNI